MTSTLLTCTSSTRPASPAAGDTLFETDTNKIIVYSGSDWKLYDSDGQAINDSDITSLSPHLWLDPSYSSSFFTDSSKGTAVTTDGARVGCFADRSGNGFDFVQATLANKPTLCKEAGIGQVSSLCYSYTDELGFVGTTSSEISAANITIFWVWRLSPEGNHFFLQGTANTNEPRLRINGSAGALKYNWNPFGSEETSGTGGVAFSTSVVSDASIPARHIYCLRTNSTANRTYSYQNGGADIAGSTTAPTGVYLEDTETTKMFAGTNNFYSPHWLFEYIVFDSSLSDANVNKVNTYLGNKHGITVTDIS
jgi:hypothetical protein